MKKLLAAILFTALSVSLLTACGSSVTPAESSEEAEATAAETTEAAESAEAAENTEATETKAVLTVGTNAEFPPFEYVGDDGQPDGFDMALIRAIGEKLGMEVVIENMEFSTLVASIGTKLDVAIAGMTVTDERKQSVDFSDSYYEAVQYVILPVDSDIKTAADLEGKKIGVQLGTTGDFIVEEIEGATAAQFSKAVDTVNDLINGRVDCVIIDKNPALVFESKFKDQVVAVDGAQFGFEPEYYAIAMPKGDTELADKINGALKELKEDGTFDNLVKTYIEQ